LAFVGSVAHERGALPGEYEAVCTIPANLLNSDTYFIDLALTFPPKLNIAFHERSALTVLMTEVIDETLHESPRSGYSGVMPGVVRPRLDWKIDRLS
jgi:lipopolysaccharide transport system ATP-binding protein